MEPPIFWTFIGCTALMIALPGPSVMLTLSHSLAYGWRRALLTVTGETLGIALQLLFAAAGFSLLINTAAQVFRWIRFAGAAYLIFLGLQQWRAAGETSPSHFGLSSGKGLLLQGLVVTIPNPKSLLFMASFLPQFLDTGRPLAGQYLFLVPSFLVLTFSITALWALAAGKAGSLQHSRGGRIRLYRGTAVLMILAAVGLILARI